MLRLFSSSFCRALYQQFVTEIIVNPHSSEDGGDSGALVDHVRTHTHPHTLCTQSPQSALPHFHAAQPLNPNPESAWSKYFKDNEQLLQIDHDCRYVCRHTVHPPPHPPPHRQLVHQCIHVHLANTPLIQMCTYINNSLHTH